MTKKHTLLGTISLICLIVTVVWLVLFIYASATQGAVETPEQALDSVADLGLVHHLTYVNATLVTLSAVMLFAGLAVRCWSEASLWAAMGAAFVPIYGLLNLFAYLSQITIVPRLAALRPAPDLLLAQMVQAWPGSAVNILNNLGYAVLGIPSVIFGLLLGRQDPSLRLAGILLALSGVASILGMVGIAAQSAVLGLGSIVGGVLFLVALIPLSVVWLQEA
ncbi:MAG: hypothetical protein PVI59_15310 [Anaerolineae bacterium]|jgi:hypothetical protein